MDVATSLEKLFSLHNFGIKLGLENTLKFLDHLGNPQHDLRTIHVAGSNGKGSTASFIASILQECGFRTGLYTSPHFVRFNERVQINSVQISDDYIAQFVTEHENYIDRNKLTFFEVTTAMAFTYFLNSGADYCVIETGLGGRLDATNVINPLSTIITSISLEHTNVLGDRLEKIAFEKSAIIKQNSKVFIGYLKPEAEKVVVIKCREMKSSLFKLKDFTLNDSAMRIDEKLICFDKTDIPLRGNYQKSNAALAALAVMKSLDVNGIEVIKRGIKNVIQNTGLQGRYEYYHEHPTIIFDSAHNCESIENFIDEFKEESKQYSKKVLLFGTMRDKAIGEMLKIIKPHFDEVVLAEIDYERSAKIGELREICEQNNIIAFQTNDPADYVQSFRGRDKLECLVVLGSIYLLGKVKSSLSKEAT